MKNLKVSFKLLLSFGIVIVLSIIVGLVGIFGMAQINAADDMLYDNNYLPTVMAADIAQAVVEQRVVIRNFVIYDINEDPQAFANAETDMSRLRNEMQSLLNEYSPTIINPVDQAAYNEFTQVYNNEWLPTIENIRSLGASNRLAEAKAALSAAAEVATRLDNAASTLKSVNLSDGQTAVNNNTSLFRLMTIISVSVLVVAVVAAAALALMLASGIKRPLSVLTSFMGKAGERGDIDFSPEETEQVKIFSQYKDEVGQCINSTAKFVDRLHDVGEALYTVAEGDLTKEIRLLSESDTMGKSLHKMVSNLNNMFADINSSTVQVSTGSKQIADGAQALAQGSTEQAAAVQELSSSISEIASKTKVNAEMAMKAASLANTIKHNAEKGTMQMDQMMDAVREINQASQSINKVIKVIDDIAFQTNILALNAAVEAARAGQHGKGFAVVAEEVRNLAAKSAEAAKDTGGLIANSMEKAELGARIADETAASLTEIVSGINESTKIVSDIARSSEEQSEGIFQVNKGIEQVAQVVQQNSATAEQSAAASQEMSGQSTMLEQLISQFKLKNQKNTSNWDRLPSVTPSYETPARYNETSPVETSSYDFNSSGSYGKY